MKDLVSEYLILWASQTGNAERIAKSLHTEALTKGYTGKCFVMDEYESISFQGCQLIIFITSNTGDGDAPDNSLKFWKFLNSIQENTYFENSRFTVLGLGDSNYSNFNATSKKLEKKILDLGGTLFYPKALADNSDGLESVVDPWVEKLWESLPSLLKQDIEIAKANLLKSDQEEQKKMTEYEIQSSDIPFTFQYRQVMLPKTVEKYKRLPNTLVNNYSFLARTTDLPAEVNIYKDLDNSLIIHHKDKHVKQFPFRVDLNKLKAGEKLTGLPRVPAPIAKFVKLQGQRFADKSGNLPEFVSTPTPIKLAPVTMVSCLTTPDAVKRTLEIELNIGKDNRFEPGDAFGVIAPNNEGLVRAIFERLNVTAADYYQLYQLTGDNLPSYLQKAQSVTLYELFLYGVDITSQPRKVLFRLLADYTNDLDEKLSLIYLSSKEGVDAYNSVRDEVPNLLDILESFPSCIPPITRLLDILPVHLPRFYSISSSPLKRPGKVRFAFNIVEYVTKDKSERKGVATPWLDKLTKYVPSRTTAKNVEVAITENIRVPMYIRQNANAFVLPKLTERPMILIGPGTGITPFIGFLEHRQAQRKLQMESKEADRNTFGSIYVYYGFRDKNKDFLFEKDLREFEKDGTITHLALAESRATDGSPKVYVQDLIKRDSDILHDLIVNQDGYIYICGDAKGMANSVQDALAGILVQHQKVDVEKAHKILNSWIVNKKYLRDLWA